MVENPFKFTNTYSLLPGKEEILALQWGRNFGAAFSAVGALLKGKKKFTQTKRVRANQRENESVPCPIFPKK